MGQLLSTSSKHPHLIPFPALTVPHGKAEADILLSDSSSELSSSFPEEKNSNNDSQETYTIPLLHRAKGHYYHPLSGPKILDACGGAGVACLGHGKSNKSVIKAITKQLQAYQYASYAHFRVDPVLQLEKFLCESTDNKMGKMYLMCSGSEATEAALKFALEYHVWNSQPQRVNIISRSHSYHGTTLGSLSASGHTARRAPFTSILNTSHFHHLPPCNPYRSPLSPEDYLHEQISHLESLFLSLNPSTVAAVILEPIVGAALACAPPLPNYLTSVKSLCHRHGALLIYDEVMCGMGRTSSSPSHLHTWQSFPENSSNSISPDLQTIAKSLSAGYLPASALLISTPISHFMTTRNKTFTHGHTYQSHPPAAAAALAVQLHIQHHNLLSNVSTQGSLLIKLLKEKLAAHKNVGDIRGRGLFVGIEFVRDKPTKQPFDKHLDVAGRVHRTAVKNWQVLLYSSQGCADDDGRGDAVMVMPAYDVTPREIKEMVRRIAGAVEEVFRAL